MVEFLRSAIFVLSTLGTAAMPSGAVAQTYPAKSMRMIVPWPPGGIADMVGRLVAHKINAGLGQTVVVDNIPGASGTIGTRTLVNAPKDGYTLITVTSGHAMNAAAYAKLPFNALTDVAPVIAVAHAPSMLVVHPSLPVKTVKALLEVAKARPGELTYGSSGTGSPAHMFFELFKSMAGVNLLHVPYKSSPQALTDVMGGRVMIYMVPFPVGLPHVKAGRLRALATTGTERSALMPELPTIAEAGVPGYEANQWIGVLAPAGTPQEVIALINTTVANGLTAPDVRESLAMQGLEVFPRNTPSEFAAFLKNDVEKWNKVAKEMNISLD